MRGKGEGHIETLPSGKYRAVLSLGINPVTKKRERVTATFSRLRDAQSWLRDRRAEKDQGLAVRPERITLHDWLDRWLEIKKSRVDFSTWCGMRTDVRRLQRQFGSLLLGQLTPVAIEEIFSKLVNGSGIGPAAACRCAKTLKQALKNAAALGVIPTNPARNSVLPRVEKKQIEPLTEEQVRRFLKAARSSHYYPLFWLAVETGARQGELFALHWEDYDSKKQAITIRRSLSNVNGILRIKDVKTGSKGRRTLPISDVASALLDRLRRDQGVLAGPIFTTPNGRLIRKPGFHKNVFSRVLRKAKLKFRFHDLRHTCASLLLAKGVNVKVVSERLGHASINVTLSVYAHVLPGQQEKATEVISKIMYLPS